MSASLNWMAWKLPMACPNCLRTAACVCAASMQKAAPPKLHAPMLMRPPSTAKHQSLSGRTGQTLNQQGLLAASNESSWAVSRQMGCSFKGACSYVDAVSIHCKTPVMKRADGLGPESARLLTASKNNSWAVSRQKGRSFKGACSYVDAAPIHCKTHQSFSGRMGQTLNWQGLLTASNGYSWAVSR